MRKLLTAGIFGTILGIVGAGTANASIVSSGFLDEKLTEYALSTSLDLKANQSDLTALSNKIGNDWPFNSDMMPGLHYLVSEFYPPEISLKNTSDLAHFLFGGALESGLYQNAAGVLNFLGEKIINVGDYEFLSGKVLDGFRSLTQLTNGWTDKNDGTTYLGIKDLNTKISTLPKEIMLFNVGTDKIEPVNVKELGVHNYFDIINYLLAGGGLEYNDSVIAPLAVLSQSVFRTNVLDTKIGKLPTEIPNMDSIWTRYGFVEDPGTPIDLPDTIGGMFAMLFNEDGSYNGLSLRNIMAKILMGFDVSGGRIKGLGNLSAAYDLIGDSPIVTAVKANTAKIGDLPTEYVTVGAALTAIKGIAEDAKAAALAAIPDPKQEGSSGKFVLTVDIVGDNATYRWEKIDREGETTTTTE